MASTIDQISSLASPTWREAATRAARQRVIQVPDRTIRARQVVWTAMHQILPEPSRASGVAAYARQQEQFSRWQEAATSRPVRTVLIPPDRSSSIGVHLDIKL